MTYDNAALGVPFAKVSRGRAATGVERSLGDELTRVEARLVRAQLWSPRRDGGNIGQSVRPQHDYGHAPEPPTAKMSDKTKLRERLEAQQADLERDIARLRESTGPIAPDVAIGRLTRMEAIASKGVQEAALRDAEQKLLEVEQAIARLDDPKYGLCTVCGQPIAPARLEFMPECSTCVACASA